MPWIWLWFKQIWMIWMLQFPFVCLLNSNWCQLDNVGVLIWQWQSGMISLNTTVQQISIDWSSTNACMCQLLGQFGEVLTKFRIRLQDQWNVHALVPGARHPFSSPNRKRKKNTNNILNVRGITEKLDVYSIGLTSGEQPTFNMLIQPTIERQWIFPVEYPAHTPIDTILFNTLKTIPYIHKQCAV